MFVDYFIFNRVFKMHAIDDYSILKSYSEKIWITSLRHMEVSVLGALSCISNAVLHRMHNIFYIFN